MQYPEEPPMQVGEPSAECRAEAALRLGETKFRALIENASEIVSVLDANGAIRYQSPASQRVLGYRLGELTGVSAFDLIHPDDRPRALEIFRRVLATPGSVAHNEFRFRHKDGSWRILDATGKNLLDDPDIAGIVINSQDITERKRAEEALRASETRYRTLFENTRDAIGVSIGGMHLTVNPAYAALFGYARPEDLIGVPVLNLIAPSERDFMRQRIARRAAGYDEPLSYESRGLRADGTEFDYELHVSLCELNGQLHTQVIARDITERKRMEEALREQQAQAQALNRRLQQSMMETHHRVKNNLQVIAAMVDMQAMEYAENVPVKELRRLIISLQTLAAVHDILTQQAKENRETDLRLSAKEILEKLLPMLQQTVGNRPMQFHVEDVGLTARQGTSLALVTNELTLNAFKHGEGEVCVSLTRQNGQAILQVCNEGAGFPPGFDPWKAASTGLDIVLNLSRWDLGGEAIFENLPAGGARVTVTIRLTEEG